MNKPRYARVCRRWLSVSSYPRAVVVVIAVVSHVLVISGLPLPVRAPEAKDHAEPFPCMNRPCGCRTAQQCWRSCCCFTPRQRLAWARRNKVQPPAYAALADGQAEGEDAEPSAVQPRCCESRERSCSQAPPARASDSECCRTEHVAADDSACCRPTTDIVQPPADATQASPSGVIGLFALRCQGLGTDWALTGAALPPPAHVTWQPEFLPRAWLTELSLPVGSTLISPAVPPPRG
jgi:hypothetical protein